MKIKNIFILSMMAGMTLASCNYTDLSPQDSFTDKSYWNSANDLKMYANGLYNNMLAGPSAGYDGMCPAGVRYRMQAGSSRCR